MEERSLDQIRRDVRRLKAKDRETMREEYRFAIDYLKNRQVRDVISRLIERFPESQSGTFGQEIKPITIPLTERFVAEEATLYNKGVRRYFVDPTTGKESEATKAQTTKLNRMLDAAHCDETMHQNDRIVCLLKTNCVWPQLHRGKLRLVMAYPHLVYPVAPAVEDAVEFDPADPDDYLGFVVETQFDKEDVSSAQGSAYTYLTPGQSVTYQGDGPEKMTKIIEQSPVPFVWEHRDENGNDVDSPGRMLTFWHKSLSADELLEYADCEIARANRELNVLWSILFDTVRFQSYATPVKKVINKNDPGARQVHGARFPVTLQLEEEFKYESAGSPYADTVKVLDHYAKLIAAAKRQNPEEWNVDGSGSGKSAASGFSKLVSSLPKIEARQERAKRCAYLEEHELAPRIVAIGIATGDLDAVAAKMQMRVDYPDIEIQRTSQERQIDYTVDLALGLTTPAKIMSDEDGIDIEEAEAAIEANLKRIKELGVSLAPAKPGAFGQDGAQDGQSQTPDKGDGQSGQLNSGLFGQLINGGAKRKLKEALGVKDQEKNTDKQPPMRK